MIDDEFESYPLRWWIKDSFQ